MNKQQLLENLNQFAQKFEEFLEPQVLGVIILFVVLFLFIPFCFLVIFFRLKKLVNEMKQTLDQVTAVSKNIDGVSKNIEYMGISLIEFLTTYRTTIEAQSSSSQKLEEYDPENSQNDSEKTAQILSDHKALQALFKIFKKQ